MSIYRSDVMRSIHATAKGLWSAGILSEDAFREIEASAFILPPSPDDVHGLLESQAVDRNELARDLYVTPELVRQWESGVARPEGPALKLLDLVRRKGIDAIR